MIRFASYGYRKVEKIAPVRVKLGIASHCDPVVGSVQECNVLEVLKGILKVGMLIT